MRDINHCKRCGEQLHIHLHANCKTSVWCDCCRWKLFTCGDTITACTQHAEWAGQQRMRQLRLLADVNMLGEDEANELRQLEATMG